MKKAIIIILAALFATSVSFAQTSGKSTAKTRAKPQAQGPVMNLSGKLELVQDTLALKSGGKTYLIPSLQRINPPIKGLVEGATVSVEGYEVALPDSATTVLLHISKLTFGGKDYDLSQQDFGSRSASGAKAGASRGTKAGG